MAVWSGTVSTHCGSWLLAACQAKQNLIPSAGKARPPRFNPMLSCRVVWSAHTALPRCVSPLGWKKMLLVGMSHPALPSWKFVIQRGGGGGNKKNMQWFDYKVTIYWRGSKSQTEQEHSMHAFIPSKWSQRAALPAATSLSYIASVCECWGSSFLPLIICTWAQLSLSNCLTQEAALPVIEFGKGNVASSGCDRSLEVLCVL